MSTQNTHYTKLKVVALALLVAVAPGVLADIEVEPDGLSSSHRPPVTQDIEVEPDGLTSPQRPPVTQDIEVEPDGLLSSLFSRVHAAVVHFFSRAR